MTISIAYEHAEFIIINKPIGINMHTESDNLGIVELCKRQFGFDSLYLTHRLDTPTSGCLLLAKTQEAASLIGKSFENKDVQKLYFALSDKKPQKKQGKIAGDMQKARDGNYKLAKSKSSPAITRFVSHAYLPNKRLFVCKPITGKTHQIRVALKSLSAPIIGDKRYKGSESDRLYLHSYLISFVYKSEKICVTTLPKEGEWFSKEALNKCFDEHGLPELKSWPES